MGLVIIRLKVTSVRLNMPTGTELGKSTGKYDLVICQIWRNFESTIRLFTFMLKPIDLFSVVVAVSKLSL